MVIIYKNVNFSSEKKIPRSAYISLPLSLENLLALVRFTMQPEYLEWRDSYRIIHLV